MRRAWNEDGTDESIGKLESLAAWNVVSCGVGVVAISQRKKKRAGTLPVFGQRRCSDSPSSNPQHKATKRTIVTMGIFVHFLDFCNAGLQAGQYLCLDGVV
jgi:hypothetical protein